MSSLSLVCWLPTSSTSSTESRARWFSLLGLVLLAMPAGAGPIRSGFTTAELPPEDDTSSAPVGLGFTGNFLGQEVDTVYVNSNGNITFDTPLTTFTPYELSSTDRAIIAPFFADVDTTATGRVTFGAGQIDGRNAFAATWTDVGYYDAARDKTNSFQVVLTDRSDTGAGNFDIEFNYERIEWETGDFNGGVEGLGGASARVGYAAGGDDAPAFEWEGSGVNGAFLDNSPTALSSLTMPPETFTAFDLLPEPGDPLVGDNPPGRLVFAARDGSIQRAGGPDFGPADPDGGAPPVVPEPSGILLALLGLGGAGWWRRQRLRAD